MAVSYCKNYVPLMVCVLLLAACSNPYRAPQPQLVAEPNSVDLMLADAADRATRALETLSTMEQTQLPIKPIATVANAPLELQRAVSFDWSGPVEPLVEELTRKSGYGYGVIGAKPPLPIIVNIKATNTPLIEVLRDVGMQMGARADLKVDGEMRVIEIHYAATVNRAEP